VWNVEVDQPTAAARFGKANEINVGGTVTKLQRAATNRAVTPPRMRRRLLRPSGYGPDAGISHR
jgi:hypothetical protein